MKRFDLEENMGQLFQISLPQDNTARWEKLIEEIRPGSIVIQGANVSSSRDIKAFVKSLCIAALLDETIIG